MVSQFYPPTIGGEEHQVWNLSTALAQRGHEVSVATIHHPGLPEFENDKGVRVYRIKGGLSRFGRLFRESARRHAPPFPDPELSRALARVIKRERPDVVHGHNWLIRSFIPLKAWSGARLVVSLHDYSSVCAKKSLVYEDDPCSGPEFIKCLRCSAEHYGRMKGAATVIGNYLLSPLERRAVDLFLPVSEVTASGNGLSDADLPYTVVPNFLPDSLGGGVTSDAIGDQLPRGEFFLFVGDVRRFKGVHVLVEAYAALDNPPPLILIGRICADAPTKLPNGVRLLGPQPHHAVLAAWSRNAIAVAPSVGLETFGIGVLEAMAFGCPVVASRIGGLIDLVRDGETGLLVSPNDVDGLRCAMRTLSNDPGLRRRMGEAGRLRADQFRARVVVPRYEAIYEQVVASRPRD
jgi:glycosyltransferase involved in cell wall biosynthesis